MSSHGKVHGYPYPAIFLTLVETNKKRVLVQWLMIGTIAIGILIYSAVWKPIFASHSVKDLPQGVVMLTPAIPGMGEHWADPDNYLGDYHCYKVCSIEREPCFVGIANAIG